MKKIFTSMFEKLQRFVERYILRKKKVQHKPLSDFDDSIAFGDVFFCLMPLSEKELKTVGEHHKSRPYLISDTLEDGVLAFYGTSKVKTLDDTDPQYFKHHFDRPSYKLDDDGNRVDVYDTYFDVETKYFIPTENISHFLFSLTENEKQILIRKNHRVAQGKDRIKIDPYIQKGDVIQKNNRQWYVYKSTPSTFSVYPFLKEKETETCVMIHLPQTNRRRYVDCDVTEKIAREGVKTTLCTLEPKDIAIIDNFWEELKIKKKKQQRSDYEKNAKRIYFLYPFGERLRDSKWGTVYIYLYSIRRTDYVIDTTALDEGTVEIYDTNNARQLDPIGLQDEDTLYDLINAFYEVNPEIHAIADSIATDDDVLQLDLIQSEKRYSNEIFYKINDEYKALKEQRALEKNGGSISKT